MSTINYAVSLFPLSSLHIDDKINVRHLNRSVDPILKASIKAIGLLTPLLVRKNSKGYAVIAGGQRLAALQALNKEGEFADNADVPCILTDDTNAAAVEKSLAENVARSPMHQVDEFKAFAALANDKENPQTPEQIATRFGIDVRRVEQRLALGALDETVLQAFAEDRIKVDAVRAFTLTTNKKAQRAALEKLEKGNNFVNGYAVRAALGLNDDSAGKYLALIGEENYIARGGKVTHDLFSDQHIVSDPALVKTMVEEMLSQKCQSLVADDGWKWATSEIPAEQWRYNRVNVESEPTRAEAKELKRLKAIIEANEEADDFDETRDAEADAASEAYDKLEAEIAARAYTPAIKAKAGCFVEVSNSGTSIEITPRYEPRAEPVSKKEVAEKAKVKAAKAAHPEDNVSQALIVRMGSQLTAAAQSAIVSQPNVALAALIAALASRSDVVGIHPTSRGDWQKKLPSFTATMQDALKLSTAKQIEVLTQHVAQAVKLVDFAGRQPALDDIDRKTLAHAVDGKKLTAALREKFDAKDFFNSVSRATIVDAVREAMGDDHAAAVAKMDKAAATKFAITNVPKTKWLPKQLRVPAYDGPARKAKAPAKKKAKR